MNKCKLSVYTLYLQLVQGECFQSQAKIRSLLSTAVVNLVFYAFTIFDCYMKNAQSDSFTVLRVHVAADTR